MKQFSICLTILIILMSCHEDSDEVITIIENPLPPPVLVTTRLVSIIDSSIIEAHLPEQTFAGHTASFELIPYAQIKDSGIDRDYELIRLTTDASLSFSRFSPWWKMMSTILTFLSRVLILILVNHPQMPLSRSPQKLLSTSHPIA